MSHLYDLVLPKSEVLTRCESPASYSVTGWGKCNLGTLSGSGFTLSSHTLTCVVRGWYLVRFGVYAASGSVAALQVYKNGTAWCHSSKREYQTGPSLEDVVYLDVGDTMELWAEISTTITTHQEIGTLHIGRLQ